MSEHVVVQLPQQAAAQLFLLFHGVGSTPENLAPLGERLAAEFPQAAVISVAAPDASDFGAGRQWFSVQGVTEANRAARIAATMDRFVATVRSFQELTGAGPERTALVGFSQGAIMALEASLLESAGLLAGRVVSLSGRFAALPERAPAETTLHFIHGDQDGVIAYQHAVDAAERLVALDGDVTADVLPRLGHGVDKRVADLMVERLKGHVPRRIWAQAMAAAQE
ncbi:esterase [Xylophilus rhododendri]|uniref:Esterase n=1 Tax=Xylophilus rhododendri TaxID=2697032 RepID=A0A857J2F8_9BURK|nr:esterase [Xylophilus rhododendri]QHI98110.1 esterase [Xylophilus rhododendri]